MKRNFLTLVAMMVAAFFIGTEIAQAADLSLSGQLRHRYASNEHTNFDVGAEADDGIGTRVRFNIKSQVNSDTGVFVQFQSVHGWGNETSATGGDADERTGIHQAYFTLKNFAGLPINAKAGRQEIVLDGHRLFGHTGWADSAHTHDAILLSHAHGNSTSTYGYSNMQELANGGGAENDVAAHFLHTNFQGVLGGALSTYIVYVDDDCGVLSGIATCAPAGGAGSQWVTLGGRQAGKMYGLDYRAEAYWQVGNAFGANTAIPGGSVSIGPGGAQTGGYGVVGDHADRDAYMFGVRVGKAFPNVQWKPKITLWYDYLSGNDDEDMNEHNWGAFDTLFDTGHKFYGFMDFYTNGQGSGTGYFGLQDIAIKLVMKPRPGWTLKADIHNFHTAESVSSNPDMMILQGYRDLGDGLEVSPGSADSGTVKGTELGTEVDLTLVHSYNPNVKFVFGYSMYMAEALTHTFRQADNALGNANAAEWWYVMADLKF